MPNGDSSKPPADASHDVTEGPEPDAGKDDVANADASRSDGGQEAPEGVAAPSDDTVSDLDVGAEQDVATGDADDADSRQESEESAAEAGSTTEAGPATVASREPADEAEPTEEPVAAEAEELAAETEPEEVSVAEEAAAEAEAPKESVAAEPEELAAETEPELEPVAEQEQVAEQEPEATEEPEPSDEDEAPEPVEETQEDDKKQWYVLKVQSNRENTIREAIVKRVRIEGLEEYLGEIVVPTEKVSEIKGGKKRVTQRKFFPGYIMVNVELNDDIWFAVRETPGVGDFVGAGGHPVPMSEDEVDRMLGREAAAEAEQPRLKINFQKGDRVKIKEGTFENFEGDVEEVIEAKGKVQVVIQIFGRPTPVELEYWQVESV